MAPPETPVVNVFDAACATHGGFSGPSCPKCEAKEELKTARKGDAHGKSP